MKTEERSIEFMQYAASKIKSIGFVLYSTSMKSEACYYNIPPSKKLLRIASHRKSKTDGFGKKVIAAITFSPQCLPRSKEKVDQIICLAIGQYILSMGI